MKPVLLSLVVSLATASAGDWPNWRGPHFDGSSDEASLPTKADPASALWKAAMPGPAASSPIVAAGKVFITTTDEKEKSRNVNPKTAHPRDGHGARNRDAFHYQ